MDDRHLVRIAIIIVLVLLLATLGGWLFGFLYFGRSGRLAVYYMAGHLMAQGQSPYLVTQSAWERLAAELHIAHYTQPYRYPPYTAVIGRLLGPLGERRAEVVWEIAGALCFVAGAWLVGLAIRGGWRTSSPSARRCSSDPSTTP